LGVSQVIQATLADITTINNYFMENRSETQSTQGHTAQQLQHHNTRFIWKNRYHKEYKSILMLPFKASVADTPQGRLA
jgi:hypothetical protein